MFLRRLKKYDIMIETTNICNAKCKFCANPTLNRKKEVMSDEVFHIIIRRILEEKICVGQFILHLNGEPFTDKKLLDRIQTLKIFFPDVKIRFATNFSLPNEQMIDALMESGIDSITISLNAITETDYREVMGLDYNNTLHNIEYLLAKNKRGGGKISVCLSIVDLGDHEVTDKFVEKYSTDAEVRVMHLGQWIDKEKPENLVSNNNNFYKCQALWNSICILSNGDFALCCFDCEGHVGLNVRDNSILDAFYSEAYLELRRYQIKHGRKGSICENCSFSF